MPDTAHSQSVFEFLFSQDLDRVRNILMSDPGLVHIRRVIATEDDEYSRRETPLQVAASIGNIELAKMLVEFGADPYMAAQWGYPPVQHAHWAGQSKSVEWFLTEAARHPSMSGNPTYGLGVDINLAARNGWKAIVEKHRLLADSSG